MFVMFICMFLCFLLFLLLMLFGFLCELLGLKIQKIESYGLEQFPLLDLLQGCKMTGKF